GQGVGKPLSQIANALKKGEGRWPELDHINPGPTLEIQEFAAILRQMISELEQAEQKRPELRAKAPGHRTNGINRPTCCRGCP
ncbi:MAG: hypothetical protein ACYSWZ_14350, partial [Planctomycetota bacterium]